MNPATPLNPYITGSPVSGKSLYGREDLFDFVRDALRATDNYIILLHGQRRVGKSSILHHLKNYTLPGEGYLAALIDLQSIAHERLDQILCHIGREIAQVTNLSELSSAAIEDNSEYFNKSFIPQIVAELKGRRLVVLIDEFDMLRGLNEPVEGSQANIAGALLATFGQLSEQYLDHLSFILVVARQYQHLPPELKMWLRESRARSVWLLDDKSARELIVKPAAGLRTYQPGAINKILALASGHPFLTQLLCYEVFSHVREKGRTDVTPGDVEAVIGRALETGSAGINWIWQDVSLSGRLTLSAFSEAVDEYGVATADRIQQILERHRIKLGSGMDPTKAAIRLREEKILALGSGNDYKFEVEMVRRWVLREHPIHREKQLIESLSRSAVGYYETATSQRVSGRLDEAIANFRQALDHNPNHLGAQLGLAQALEQAGDLAGGVEAFEQAYWLDEVSSRQALAEALLALAGQERCQGQLHKAVQHYRRVLEIDPQNQTLDRLLGEWFNDAQKAHELGDHQQATTHLSCIMQLNPEFRKTDVARLIEAARQSADVPEREPQLRWPRLVLGLAGIAGLLLVISVVVIAGTRGCTPFATLFPFAIGAFTPTGTPILVPVTASPSATSENQPPSPTPTSVPTLAMGETPPPTDPPTPTNTPYIIYVTATFTPTLTLPPAPTATYTPTPTPAPSPLPPGRAADVAVNLRNGQQLFVTLPTQGIYRSNDGGYTWRKVWPVPGAKLGAQSLRAITLDPTSEPHIYAATFNGMVWSSDGGQTWQESSGDFGEGHLPREAQVYAASAASDGSGTVYAGTQRGLFVGEWEDGRLTWNSAQARLRDGEMKVIGGPIYTVAVDQDGSRRVFAAGKGDEIYRSEDGGATWEVGACGPCGSNVFALAYAQGKLFAAGGQKDSNPTLAISYDRGDTWTSANKGIPTSDVPDLVVSALAIDPKNPQVLYAGTGFLDNDKSHGIYRSQDGGVTWTVINRGLSLASRQAKFYVQGIVVDPTNSQTIYLAGFGGVYKSSDGGDTWSKQ